MFTDATDSYLTFCIIILCHFKFIQIEKFHQRKKKSKEAALSSSNDNPYGVATLCQNVSQILFSLST